MIPHMHQESVEKLIAHNMRLPGESRAEFQEVENSLREQRGKTSLSHFILEKNLVRVPCTGLPWHSLLTPREVSVGFHINENVEHLQTLHGFSRKGLI